VEGKKLLREAETIPDDSNLFRRVHPALFNPKTRKFAEGAFLVRPKKNEKALSVNWEKYATAEQTSYDDIKTKKYYCVGSILARIPRTLNLEVIHKPNKDNQAHSVICGDDLLDSQKSYVIAGNLVEECEPIIIIDGA
jgi:hypothetical protein